MSKAKLLFAVFIAVLSVSALASASASAAEWMVGGSGLTTTAALKTTAKVDENGVLSGGGLTITCTGNLEGKKPEIVASNKIKAEALIFTGCSATPAECTVPTTIGTVPIEGEATLSGTKAVKGNAKPQSGSVFTTIKVGGEEKGCAAAGNKPVKGDVAVEAPTGQEEKADQELVVNQASSTLLLLGSSSASLKGKALLLLASGSAWSFL